MYSEITTIYLTGKYIVLQLTIIYITIVHSFAIYGTLYAGSVDYKTGERSSLYIWGHDVQTLTLHIGT